MCGTLSIECLLLLRLVCLLLFVVDSWALCDVRCLSLVVLVFFCLLSDVCVDCCVLLSVMRWLVFVVCC